MELNFCFQKAITLNADQDADAFWEELEKCIRKSKYIIIDGGMKDYGHEQIIMRFIDKYKAFVDYFFTSMETAHGKAYVKLRQSWKKIYIV